MILTYQTRNGEIRAKEPTVGQMANLKKGLPLGFIGMQTKEGPSGYGFVTKCGEEEAWALKQQFVEIEPKDEATFHTANSILLAQSVKRYMSHGFGGCLAPCLYRREKPNGIELGFAYFGSPLPTGIEAMEFPPEPAYDNRFGNGFLTLFRHFHDSLVKSSEEGGIPLRPVIGLDQRTTSQLGNLILPLIIHGNTLFLCRSDLREDDLFLTVLSSCGIREFVHLPCQSVAIREEHRKLAKRATGQG